MICDKAHCIANYNGECAVEKCQGEIDTTRNVKNISREERKKLYQISKNSFEIYFGEEG